MPKDRKPRLIVEEREEEPQIEPEPPSTDVPGEATPEEPPVEEHQGQSLPLISQIGP